MALNSKKTAGMKKRVSGPLTEEERKDFQEMLHDEKRMEELIDRAVRGMWGPVRRAKRVPRSS